MSKLLHIKGSKTRVLDTFPANNFGNDGDIVISRIKGKGVYLCSKAGNMWYAANRMQELRRVEKSTIRELSTGTLTISNLKNTKSDTDRFLVSDAGRIKYRTGEQVVNDLSIPVSKIDYKTAYCSLGQYTDKESCKANGGTWYYSENDSHDSISSTAENQLLTIGQTIGNVDAEPTLLYDGSTLEIKHNSDFDDNWQTSAQTNLLKLSYDSDKYAIFDVDSSGELEVTSSMGCTMLFEADGDIKFDADGDMRFYAGGNDIWFFGGDNNTAFSFDASNKKFTITQDITFPSDYFLIDVGGNGTAQIQTVDGSGTAGHLTIKADGRLQINTIDGIFYFSHDGGSSWTNIFKITVGDDGATELATVDASATAGHLTLVPDGDLILDPASQKTIINATDGLYFDGGGDTYIAEGSADKMEIVVGGDEMITLDEANDRITLEASKLAYKIGSGGDEFSVADSAWAGMILGYRMIGEDASRETYTLTTSYVVPIDDMTVRFIAPPSGAVEIMIQIKVDAQANNDTYVGLSSANATSGYATIGATYEQAIGVDDETDNGNIQHYWAVTGLTAGTTYNYWVGFKKRSAGIGNGYLNWGGGSGEHCDFIMKATALPTAVADFAVYD